MAFDRKNNFKNWRLDGARIKMWFTSPNTKNPEQKKARTGRCLLRLRADNKRPLNIRTVRSIISLGSTHKTTLTLGFLGKN